MLLKKFSQEEFDVLILEVEEEWRQELEVKQRLEEQLKKQWDNEAAISINQQLQGKEIAFNKLLEERRKKTEADFFNKLAAPPLPPSITIGATTTQTSQVSSSTITGSMISSPLSFMTSPIFFPITESITTSHSYTPITCPIFTQSIHTCSTNFHNSIRPLPPQRGH